MTTTRKPDPALSAPAQQAQQELASRVLSKRRLVSFTQRINPRYMAGWVHHDIARRLERFSDAVAAGLSPRLMILMPPRHGKLCADDTRVPTPNGWTTHGELRPGDEVFGPDGVPTKVLAVSEPAAADVRVELSDGSVHYVHEDHEWTLYERSARAWNTRETRWLMSSARGPRKLLSGNRCMYQLPVAEALQYAGTDYTLHPYALGAWLGDGSQGKPCITHNRIKQPVVDRIVAPGYPVSTVCTHATTGVDTTYFSGPRPGVAGRMTLQLQALGIYTAKRIPASYQRLTFELRMQLLAGLIDTDGSTDANSRVTYSSARRGLAEDVFELALGLGLRPYLQRAEPALSTSGIQGRQVIWTVGFQPTGPIPCAVAHKRPTRFAPQRRTGFTDVRHDPQGKVGRCIQVDRADGLYLIGDKLTVTHNSELASRMFPAWHLGRHPDHEIIACSYNVSLAMSFSRKVKETIQDPAFESVFPIRLNPNNQSAEEWGLAAGLRGGYVAAGVGGGITGKGAHCLPAGTRVSTASGQICIERLYQLNSLPEIVTPSGLKRALAITKRPAPALYELRFASGAVLRATGAHPVYLPDRAEYVSVEKLYGEAQGDGRSDLRVVRESVPAAEVQPRQIGAAGVEGVLLLEGLQSSAPRDEERQALPDVQVPGTLDTRLQERGVLLRSLLPEDSAAVAAAEDLPAVQRGVSADVFVAGLLRGELRQYGAHDPYAWGGELELSDGQRIRVLVRPDEAAGTGTGQGVRGVHDPEEAALPPHRRGQEQQQHGEPDHAVRGAPHGAPQVQYDTLSVVVRCGASSDFVYDIQVEEAGCFFAEGVLVGNCLIVDDPIKNAEEADSADVREKLTDWYGSTAYTRLAPGGGVLVIQTCWHDSDLAGWLQTAMSDPDADQFEIVKYPAIAEQDEWIDTETDDIVRVHTNARTDPPRFQEDAAIELSAQGLDLSTHRFLRCKGDALHPERYDRIKLNRIKKTIQPRFWSALYQQNPVPDDGAYFVKENFRRAALPPIARCHVYIAFDFAISEKKQNDYTVGTVGLQDSDDVLHIAEVLRFKSGDALFIVDAILSLCRRWYSSNLVLGFEDGQIYRTLAVLLKKRMQEEKFYPSITVLTPVTDKLARARPLQGRMQQGMVSFNEQGEWYDVVRQEMLRFPAGVHDDCVDSAAWMTHLCMGRAAPRKPKLKELGSWKDKLKGLSGKPAGHMAA